MPDENQHIYKKGEVCKSIKDMNSIKFPRECAELRLTYKKKRKEKSV